MPTNPTTLSEAINRIVEDRQSKLQQFKVKKEKFDNIKKAAAEIMNAKSEIFRMVQTNEDVRNLLQKTTGFWKNLESIDTAAFNRECGILNDDYTELEQRYQKKEIAIAVVGERGSGKSCLLQSISGLDNRVIPSFYSSKDCTGADSVIRNADVRGGFQAEIVYYSSQEMLDIINSYYEIFEGNCPPAPNMLEQVKNLDVYELEKYIGKDDIGGTAKFGKLKKIIQNYDKWIDGVKEYGDCGRKRIIYEKDEVSKFVAQHNGRQLTDPEYVEYYEYISVKQVTISCNFEAYDAGSIVLRDTVGIGDTSTPNLDQRMMKALENDCDAALMVVRPESGRASEGEKQKLYDKIRSYCVERSMDKWVFLAINETKASSGKYGSNEQSCIDYKQKMIDNRAGFAGMYIVDASEQKAVREALLIPMLAVLKEQLPALDKALEKKIEAQSRRVYEEYRKLIDACDATSRAYGIGDYGIVINDFKAMWARFAMGAEDLKDIYYRRAYPTCDADVADYEFKDLFRNEINKINVDWEKIVPTADQIYNILARRDHGANPGKVAADVARMARNELAKSYINIDEKLAKMVYAMKKDVARLLTDALQFNKMLENDEMPPEDAKGCEDWMQRIYEKFSTYEGFADPKYNDIKTAIKLIAEFNISVRSFMLHRVRVCIENEDKIRKLNLQIAGLDASVQGGADMNELADVINASVIELCSRGFEAAGRSIEEMYNEPDMLLYAAISEFVDRTKNSGYRADICDINGEIIGDRLEGVGETWETMYVSNPKVFRKSMADAKEQADMLNSKLKMLVTGRISENEFIFN